jgi:hypothetical protein
VSELAVAELEQQVEVGVRYHGGSLRGACAAGAAVASLRGFVNRMLTSPIQPLSLCDGHTKPDAGLIESTLTSRFEEAHA